MSRKNGSFCINPETNRNIRIGGRTWRGLVRKGAISTNGYKSPNIAYELEEDPSFVESLANIKDPHEQEYQQMEHLYEQKQQMIKEGKVPKGKILAVRNKKIMYREPKITTEIASRRTADGALKVIDQLQNGEIEIPNEMDENEAREYLQSLIFNEMLVKKKKFKKPLKPKFTIDSPVYKAPKHRTVADFNKARRPVQKKVKKIQSEISPRGVRMVDPRMFISKVPDNIEYETETETEYQDSIYDTTETEYEDESDYVEYVEA